FFNSIKEKVASPKTVLNSVAEKLLTLVPERLNTALRLNRPEETSITPDEITRDSLLDKMPGETLETLFAQNSSESQEKTLLKVLTNFLGDGQLTGGTNKSRDGLTDPLNCAIWQRLVQDFKKFTQKHVKDEKLQGIVTQIESLVDALKAESEIINALQKSAELTPEILGQRADVIAQKLAILPVGGQLPLLGGWNNLTNSSGGHAQIYQFKRAGLDTVDIEIFTTTGLDDEVRCVYGKKVRQVPIHLYKGVPLALFTSSSGSGWQFIKTVYELQTSASKESTKDIDKRVLIEALSPFKNYKVHVPISHYGAITGQSGGTCTQVIKLPIRQLFGDLGCSKQFIYHIKFILLVLGYKTAKAALEGDSESAEELRYTFKQQARKLLSRTAKAVGGFVNGVPLIDAEFSQQVRATAHDLIHRIEAIEKRLAVPKPPMQCIIDAVDPTSQLERRRCISRPTPRLLTLASPPPYPLLNGVNAPLTEISEAIITLRATQNSLEQTPLSEAPYKRLVLMQIASLIDRLPIPRRCDQPLFPTATLQQKQELHQGLCSLLNRYADKTLYLSDPVSRRFATLYPLHAVLQQLTLEIDDEMLQHSQVAGAKLRNYSLPYYYENLFAEGLHYYHFGEFERIQSAIRYFLTPRSTQASLFDHESERVASKWEIQEDQTGHSQYWRALNGVLPNLESAAADWIADYDSLRDWSEEKIEEDYKKQLEALAEWEISYQKTLEKRTALEKEGVPSYKLPVLPTKPDCMRHINLTMPTKVIAACEAHQSQCILKQEWSHFAAFREALFALQCLLTFPDLSRSYACAVYRRADDEVDIDSSGFTRSELYSSFACERIREQRPHTAFNNWLNSDRLKRNREKWDEPRFEATTFKYTHPHPGTLQRVERTLAAGRINPAQQLFEIGREIDKLSNPELQGALLSAFFRAPYGDGFEIGAGQVIVENPTLARSCAELIRQAFARIQNLSPPPLAQLSFYLEIAFHLSHYLVQKGEIALAREFNLESEIGEWLLKPELSDDERSLLCLYRMGYRLLGSHDSLSLMEGLADWYSFQSSPSGSKKACSPALFETLQRLLSQRLSALGTSDEGEVWIRQHAQSLFRSLGFLPEAERSIERSWRAADQGIPFITDGRWTLDLLAGALYTERGKFSPLLERTFPWEKTSSFKRLFGSEHSFNYRKTELGPVEFTLEGVGEFRVEHIPPKYSWSNDEKTVIDRRFPGSEQWFRYIEPTEAKSALQSAVLSDDHSLWVAREGTSYICDLKSHAIVSTVEEDGRVLTLDSPPVELFAPRGDQVAALQNFELAENMLISRAANGNCLSLTLPRFLSVDGVPLQFEKRDNEWVWSDNQAYRLSSEVSQDLAGKKSRYLLLEGEGSRLLLFPIQLLKDRGDHLYPISELSIDNNTPLISAKSPAEKRECWGNQRYVAIQ
ncbi:MAG: hypothetical protein KDK40_03545, partial [Chlamydiia bacterium]|nr:hypothetical protein [Chlamydiia bacterium]